MCTPALYWMLSTGVCLEDSSLMPLRLIWFGTRHLLKKATENDLTLHLDSGPVHPVSAIRDLGVTLDCGLTMKHHI